MRIVIKNKSVKYTHKISINNEMNKEETTTKEVLMKTLMRQVEWVSDLIRAHKEKNTTDENYLSTRYFLCRGNM